jgi:F0F1-type ATP synthase delta subunit
MDQREVELREQLKETERNRAAAEEESRLLAQARRELEEARWDRRQAVEQEVVHWREEQLREAREEVERADHRWREGLLREQTELLEVLQERVGGLVTTTLRRVLPEFAGMTLEAQALQVFLRQLEDLEDARRTELAGALRAGAAAVVQSASELSREARERIEDAIVRHLGPPGRVSFEAAPSLICGFALRIGGYTVGWNLRDTIQQLEDEFALGLRQHAPSPLARE